MSTLSVTLTRRKHGETFLQDTHTSGNRAVTEKVDRQDSSPTKEFELKERKRDFHNIFVNKKQLHAKQEARLQVTEMESHSRTLLEEQRSQQISQAKFELLLQETKSEIEVFCVDNFALWTWKYSTRITIVKIRDKNNPFSLPKYEAVREKLVFISCKTWKN